MCQDFKNASSLQLLIESRQKLGGMLLHALQQLTSLQLPILRDAFLRLDCLFVGCI